MEHISYTVRTLQVGAQMSFGLAVLSGCTFSRTSFLEIVMFIVNLLNYCNQRLVERLFTGKELKPIQNDVSEFYRNIIKNIYYCIEKYPSLTYGVIGTLLFMYGFWGLSCMVESALSKKYLKKNEDE